MEAILNQAQSDMILNAISEILSIPSNVHVSVGPMRLDTEDYFHYHHCEMQAVREMATPSGILSIFKRAKANGFHIEWSAATEHRGRQEYGQRCRVWSLVGGRKTDELVLADRNAINDMVYPFFEKVIDQRTAAKVALAVGAAGK